jgi:molybdate transport system substrate-binding protein
MPIAVSTFSKNGDAALAFIEYACSEKGRTVFEKWGYLTREERARAFAPNAVIGGEYELPDGW